MARGEDLTVVVTDTSVLVNLAIVDRLDLLASLPGYRFRAPEEVVAEVRYSRQVELLNRALEDGQLETTALSGVSAVDHYQHLRHDLGLGQGEAACLALAHAHGWVVACDEKRAFRRHARNLLGEGRLLNTPGLFVLGIRHRYWTARDADQAKRVLERNRFRMPFRSFHDLMRRKGS